MINKFINFLYKIFYALPFGLKGADDEIFTSKTSKINDNIGVHQVIQNQRVSKDLLKGEVTQQVEELRYRDYKVYRESSKYSMDEDGELKISNNLPKSKSHKFTQINKLDTHGIISGENGVNGEERDTYTLAITYNNIPKFRIESFCKYFDIDTDSKTINIHFSKFPDKYDFKSKSFINELEKFFKSSTAEEVIRNNVFSDFSTISFTTYRANGENDMIRYSLSNLKVIDMSFNDFEYCITYIFDYYHREDLLDKYFSKSMQDKYDNKSQKETSTYSIEDNKKFYCSQCGKEMNPIDAKITKETIGYPMCKNCLSTIDFQ